MDDPVDELAVLIGNGLAKVTVSADMAIKDYGSGAGGMCSVTLTCNQDEKTIEKAISLAGSVARAYAQENRKLANDLLRASGV